MDTTAIDDVVDAIRAYLLRHPNASDSAEGIGRWWLTDNDAPPAVLNAALGRLVLDGVMELRRLPDGSSLYVARPLPQR